jgi:hypothetical protein
LSSIPPTNPLAPAEVKGKREQVAVFEVTDIATVARQRVFPDLF